MNPVLGALSPANLACTFLRIGRGPAAWQQETADVASRLDGLGRRANWVSFPEQARPRLREGPLLGRGLEIVTSGVTPPAAKRQSAPRGRRTHEKPTQTTEARHSLNSRGPSARAGRREAAEYRQLPARASRELLVKLVAGWRPGHRIRLGSSAQVDRAGGPARVAAWTAAAATEAPTAPIPPRAPTAIGDLLIRRVSHAIQGQAPHPMGPKRVVDSLRNQWSADLDGPTASLDLLNGHGEEVGVSTARQGEAGSGSGRLFQWRVERPNSDYSDGRGQAELQPALRLPQEQNEPGITGRRGPDVAGFAPPLRARFALPFQPEPDGRPASILRSGTAEAAAFDWNLSTLSVAMKRILDEDARRHGVDV